jgi:hypothetical protein
VSFRRELSCAGCCQVGLGVWQYSVQVHLGRCGCPVCVCVSGGHCHVCMREPYQSGEQAFGIVHGVVAACCWGAHGDGRHRVWAPVGMGQGPVRVSGAASCAHEGTSRWSKLVWAQRKGEGCNPLWATLAEERCPL